MLPAIIDLRDTQGDSFEQTFRLEEGGTPIDLTGSTFAASMRDRAGAVTPLTVEVGPEVGEVTLRYGEMPPTYGRYRYDVEQTDADSAVKTWVAGWITVERDVTSAA